MDQQARIRQIAADEQWTEDMTNQIANFFSSLRYKLIKKRFSKEEAFALVQIMSQQMSPFRAGWTDAYNDDDEDY